MARINIEDRFFGDDRYLRLVAILRDSDKATGVAVRFWKLGQRYAVNYNCIVPKKIFELQPNYKDVLECGLASRVKTGFYICGSRHHFEWILQKSDAGRKSAELRSKKSNGRWKSLNEIQPLALDIGKKFGQSVESITPRLSTHESKELARNILELSEKKAALAQGAPDGPPFAPQEVGL